MTRLARLRSLRGIELDRGLRGLAAAERRVGQLGDMQARLARLAAEVPSTASAPAWKAAAACRQRLADAGVAVARALADADRARGDARHSAAQLRIRVEVVDTALAAR